jgi:hypothetical protein
MPLLRDEKVTTRILDINLNRSGILRFGIGEVVGKAVAWTEQVCSLQESRQQAVLKDLVSKSCLQSVTTLRRLAFDLLFGHFSTEVVRVLNHFFESGKGLAVAIEGLEAFQQERSEMDSEFDVALMPVYFA